VKILLQHGSSLEFANLGDLAMLRVAVHRLREYFSGCDIAVLSAPGVDASRYVENVSTVDVNSIPRLLGPGCLFGRFSQGLGPSDSLLVTRYPFLMHGVVLRHWIRGRPCASLAKFIRTLVNADIVACAGGGYLTDEFPVMVEWTAWLLLAAQRLGKRTALFGQGVGPLRNPRLRFLLERALRKVEVFGLREPIYGPRLAEEFGLTRDKYVVTGDDAVELAYVAAGTTIGTKLGVNLRRAKYAGTSQEIEDQVSGAISQITAMLQTEPVVVPIGFDDRDLEVGARLVGRTHNCCGQLDVSDVIRLESECRVVLTGSYHAAVFALSQGIPAVCVVASEYYRQKFNGLAALFNSGCIVVEANSTAFQMELVNSVVSIWGRAEELRPQLLLAAKAQVETSRSIYREFANKRSSKNLA
jgi:polysaccharide pyruvyl transferase WcaK-like protein